jgi:hypothetical protein
VAKQLWREWLELIRAVEREFLVARKAVDDFLAAIRSGATDRLPPNTKLRDVEAMSDALENTYLIRLFSAFESGLRSYWASIRGTIPPAEPLIDSIAAKRAVPDDRRDQVHEVREYRNNLVHENDEEVSSVALAVARGRLCTFSPGCQMSGDSAADLLAIPC